MSFKRMMKEAGHSDSDSEDSVDSKTLAAALDDWKHPKKLILDTRIPEKIQEHLTFFSVDVKSKAEKLKEQKNQLDSVIDRRFKSYTRLEKEWAWSKLNGERSTKKDFEKFKIFKKDQMNAMKDKHYGEVEEAFMQRQKEYYGECYGDVELPESHLQQLVKLKDTESEMAKEELIEEQWGSLDIIRNEGFYSAKVRAFQDELQEYYDPKKGTRIDMEHQRESYWPQREVFGSEFAHEIIKHVNQGLSQE